MNVKVSIKSGFSINAASLTFCTITLMVILFWFGAPLIDLIELKTYDLRFRSRGQVQASPAVALAMVDEKSLDAEGRWPWPRAKIAALVNRLSEDGARVIGFDIGFFEPDENNQLILLDQVRQKITALEIQSPQLQTFIDERQQLADNDATLAHAIEASSATVVLGYFFHMSEAELGYRIEPEDIDRQLGRIQPSKYPFVIYSNPDVDVVPFFKAYAPQSNLDILTAAAAASGYFSLRNDRDGVVRWMPLMIQAGADLYPPLAVMCAWHYLDKPQLVVKVGRYGVDGIKMGKRFIPTDESGRLLINYPGPPKTFPHYSIGDILSGKLPSGTFTDKIVLVGATATGTYDMRSTPVSTTYPGAEIHAAVIDNILTQNILTRPEWSQIYDLLAIVTLGVLIGIALPRLGALKGLLFAVGLSLLHIFMADWLFRQAGMWLNMVYPLLTLATTYIVLTVYYYVTEERERKQITGAFSRYVPAKVVDELIRHPELLRLGGEERVLSVLFSDIAGFTTIAENMSPAELVSLLNEYLSAMTDIVLEHDGIIDKYEGDAIMAEFGAPVAFENHADMAVRTALMMQQRLGNLRQEWRARGLPSLACRVGISTGPMLVGNMGSQRVFDYTVIGDTVNLASRLESANKLYHTQVMISESTYDCLSLGQFQTRLLDSIKVQGKSRAVKVFEVYAEASDSIDPQRLLYYQTYGQAFEAYLARKFTDAHEQFQVALSLQPNDIAAQTMLARLENLDADNLPDDWDGSVALESK